MSPIPARAANSRSLRSGLLWIVFSPLALLMAAISTVSSDIVYNVLIYARRRQRELRDGVVEAMKRTE